MLPFVVEGVFLGERTGGVVLLSGVNGYLFRLGCDETGEGDGSLCGERVGSHLWFYVSCFHLGRKSTMIYGNSKGKGKKISAKRPFLCCTLTTKTIFSSENTAHCTWEGIRITPC